MLSKNSAIRVAQAHVTDHDVGSIRMEITSEFQRAFDIIENKNKNLFITGKAGTGKSTFLNYLAQNTLKKYILLAPTGVAAVNIGGQTIHSFFSFYFNVLPTDIKSKRFKPEVKDLIEKVELIIIDEVSMVRADLMDSMDLALKKVMNNNLPFGGKQMVFIGDMFQLPPVLHKEDEALFKMLGYNSPYFFDSFVFNNPKFQLQFIEFSKVYRQTDKHFLDVLNRLRLGFLNKQDLQLLNSRHNISPSKDKFYIYLATTNKIVDDFNTDKLNELKSQKYVVKGFFEGDFNMKSAPTNEILHLKPGAQVMLLSNDKHMEWVNGTIGTLVSIEIDQDIRQEDLKGPVGDSVEKALNRSALNQKNVVSDGSIGSEPTKINLADFDENSVYAIVQLEDGRRIKIYPYTWETIQYKLDPKNQKVEQEITGTFTQLPLRLAWAITIHKSQGKTFSNVIVDIGHGTFSPGQLYVALSRATSLEGILLKQRISIRHAWADKRILGFLPKLVSRSNGLTEAIKIKKLERCVKRNTLNVNAKRINIGKGIVFIKLTYFLQGSLKDFVVIPFGIGDYVYKQNSFKGVKVYIVNEALTQTKHKDSTIILARLKKFIMDNPALFKQLRPKFLFLDKVVKLGHCIHLR